MSPTFGTLMSSKRITSTLIYTVIFALVAVVSFAAGAHTREALHPSPTVTVTATPSPAPTPSRTASPSPSRTTAPPRPSASPTASPTAPSASPTASPSVLALGLADDTIGTTHTVSPAAVVGSSAAKSYARSHLSAHQYSCLNSIAIRESGWRVRAANPYSGAYGIGQALPGSKMASVGRDWRTNGVTQVKWMMKYVKSRYGSACGAWSFWQRHRWY